MGNDSVDIKVGADLIQPIIKAKINAAIVGAIGDPQKFVEAAVDAVMREKVNNEGKFTDAYGGNRYDMIEVLCKITMRNAARAAILEWMEGNVNILKEAVKKCMTRQSGAFAKALVAGLTEATATNYRLKVDVTLPTD